MNPQGIDEHVMNGQLARMCGGIHVFVLILKLAMESRLEHVNDISSPGNHKGPWRARNGVGQMRDIGNWGSSRWVHRSHWRSYGTGCFCLFDGWQFLWSQSQRWIGCLHQLGVGLWIVGRTCIAVVVVGDGPCHLWCLHDTSLAALLVARAWQATVTV